MEVTQQTSNTAESKSPFSKKCLSLMMKLPHPTIFKLMILALPRLAGKSMTSRDSLVQPKDTSGQDAQKVDPTYGGSPLSSTNQTKEQFLEKQEKAFNEINLKYAGHDFSSLKVDNTLALKKLINVSSAPKSTEVE